MYSPARRPISVSARTAARNMSPVEMCGTPWRMWNSSACVPLPAPGGPMKTAFICPGPSLHEAFVVAHQHVRLDLLHRLERYADDDQQRRAGQVQRQLPGEAGEEDRPYRDQPEK